MVAGEPPEEALRSARVVMEALPWQQPPGYARVDIAEDEEGVGYRLMELEMIDPMLYLEFCPHGVGRFVDVIMCTLE